MIEREERHSLKEKRIRISCGFDVQLSPQVFSAPRVWSDIAVDRREGYSPPSHKKFVF
jgi:hypothetical protein